MPSKLRATSLLALLACAAVATAGAPIASHRKLMGAYASASASAGGGGAMAASSAYAGGGGAVAAASASASSGYVTYPSSAYGPPPPPPPSTDTPAPTDVPAPSPDPPAPSPPDTPAPTLPPPSPTPPFPAPGLLPVSITNAVQAEGACVVTVQGSACGDITIQPGATATHSLCVPQSASMKCLGSGSTGPRVFQCDTNLSGQSANYAVQGLSFVKGGGDAKCTLVRF